MTSDPRPTPDPDGGQSPGQGDRPESPKPAEGETYELAPEPAGATPRESLLEGFDEDADFDRDPEVAQAMGAANRPKERRRGTDRRAKAAASEDSTDSRDDDADEGQLIPDGGVEPLLLVAAGAGGVLVGAAIAAATAPGARFAAGVMIVLYAIAAAVTGLVSVRATAYLRGVRVGDWGRAAGSIIAAVGAFQVINAITLPVLGVWGRLLIIPAAVAAYVLVLGACLRIDRDRLGVIVGLHAILTLGVWVLLQVHHGLATAMGGATP
jgi:hypothetical protein